MITYIKRKLIKLLESIITEDELLSLNARKLDSHSHDEIKTIKKDVFKDMSKIDNVDVLLDHLMSDDIKSHFSAENPAVQVRVRGMYQRTAYIKSQISKARKNWESLDTNEPQPYI